MSNTHRKEAYSTPSADVIMICPEAVLCQSNSAMLENMTENDYVFTY